jgi:hypothetical protein
VGRTGFLELGPMWSTLHTRRTTLGTDNVRRQTSLENKSAISTCHSVTARTVCVGGGRCSGREANSAEQVVGTQADSEVVCGCRDDV